MNFNYIEAFIRKVFNYYNGRINVINYPAILHVEWANLYGKTIAGHSYLPNNVVIYPMIIARYYQANTSQFYSHIIETVIHELYHMDQIIDYNLTRYSEQYVDQIERAVETQTALYMLQNQQEIAENFGIYIDEDDIRFLLSSAQYAYTSYVPYRRKRYQDQLISLISDVGFPGVQHSVFENIMPLYIDIDTIITTGNGSILLYLNEGAIYAQKNGGRLSIWQLNEFFNDNYYRYHVHALPSVDWKFEDNQMTIKISTNGANVMATYVDKGKEV